MEEGKKCPICGAPVKGDFHSEGLGDDFKDILKGAAKVGIAVGAKILEVAGPLGRLASGLTQAGIDSIPNHYYYKYHCLKCGYKWKEK